LIDQRDPFFTIPNKIFTLGLNPSELAVFVAILSHRGRNSSGMFPSTLRLAKMTSQGRTTIDKSIRTLRACNVIQWQRGKAGRANTYVMLGTGAWIHRSNAVLDPPRKRKSSKHPAKGYAQLSHNDSQSHVTYVHTKRCVWLVCMTHSHGYVRHANTGCDLDAHIPRNTLKNGDNSQTRGDNLASRMTDSHRYVRHTNKQCSAREHASVRHVNTNHLHLNQTHKTIAKESIFQSLMEKVKRKAAYAEHDD
jgi:hypothetical protein